MANAHVPLKCSYSLSNRGNFIPLRDENCKCHIITKPNKCSVCKFQINISYKYGGIKNGMLYSEDAKIINMTDLGNSWVTRFYNYFVVLKKVIHENSHLKMFGWCLTFDKGVILPQVGARRYLAERETLCQICGRKTIRGVTLHPIDATVYGRRSNSV